MKGTKTQRWWLVLMIAAAAAMPSFTTHTALAAGSKSKVLILSTSVTDYGGGSSEQTAAKALGFDADVVTPAQWAAMSTSDFSTYRALILGDPTCDYSARNSVGAAEDNANTWSKAVTGNILVVGTDPVFHSSAEPGAQKLLEKGIAFATANSIFTGAYLDLSCYYDGTAPHTAVPVLKGFGDFTVTGVGCYNDAHITANHPAMKGLTDPDLSNWSCSVHEAFDVWPDTFSVLAIAKDFGAYKAPDGSVGSPYILARGTACGEKGLRHLDSTPAKGAVSGIIHETVEPAVYPVSPDATSLIHSMNCTVIVPAEKTVDGTLP
ncbi:MAG: hypothetical protein NVSMB57_08650 [Actinomycetota bacterium]